MLRAAFASFRLHFPAGGSCICICPSLKWIESSRLTLQTEACYLSLSETRAGPGGIFVNRFPVT